MRENKRSVGKKYEMLAENYLEAHGYKVICKNFSCRIGEIDIIAMDYSGNDVFLCFIEVKYRSSEKYGYSFEAVDYRKQRNIISVSQYYRMINNIGEDAAIRYDVIGIDRKNIRLIKNAFGM